MELDNQNQKNLLQQLVWNAPKNIQMGDNLQQASNIINQLLELFQNIKNAEIKQEEK